MRAAEALVADGAALRGGRLGEQRHCRAQYALDKGLHGPGEVGRELLTCRRLRRRAALRCAALRCFWLRRSLALSASLVPPR